MKFLDYPELELISRDLCFESAECRVNTRLEAYSCKAINRDKKLFKTLESAYVRSASTSPPSYLEEHLASPFGKLDQPAARKTLWLLISTLNGAFPDHEFAEVNPADFRRERSAASVLNSLSTTLYSLRSGGGAPRSFSSFPSSYDERAATAAVAAGGAVSHPKLGPILDDIMCISECEVYTYHPDVDSDPHASADPEEGYGADDSWTEDDVAEAGTDSDAVMSTSDTPRAHDDDTPMFDEDMYEGGLDYSRGGGASSSSGPSEDGPRTPRTPRGSYFSSSWGASSAEDEAEDDDDDDTGGLLWATYVFFYNRKLKRILFVDVWSRRQTAPRARPITQHQPMSSYLPPALQQPSQSGTLGAVKVAHIDLTGGDSSPSTPLQSPAKRAMSRTNSRKRRAPSGSPAPSSLSPFPHASPQAQSAADAEERRLALASASAAPRLASSLARGAMRSLDAAVLSASAPASGTASPVSLAGTPDKADRAAAPKRVRV
ncbi:Maf1-domain-containing protein [Tilletiopsis washingtonensis]|uniref:Maf1-domain-containing protein n=1 Tax=Tilletiopsis washingtonensis TaxID=58919 RepID=A0A316ZGN0_9BASI|nr:Maf1-domain-containing protein [Tilletiopsis washingtonensis]PWO00407.1 Maf1-domain-containing protein [Tilletiopsis washingtonensis]